MPNNSGPSDFGSLGGLLNSQLEVIALSSIGILLVLYLALRLTGFEPSRRLASRLADKRWMTRDPHSEGSRTKFLRVAFGVIWIIDGVLQLRPSMPGGLVTQVADPSLLGAPSWINDIANPFLSLWNNHPKSAAMVPQSTTGLDVGLSAKVTAALRGTMTIIAFAITGEWLAKLE